MSFVLVKQASRVTLKTDLLGEKSLVLQSGLLSRSIDATRGNKAITNSDFSCVNLSQSFVVRSHISFAVSKG